MTRPAPKLPRPAKPQASPFVLAEAFGEIQFKKALIDAVNARGRVFLWRQQAGQVRGRTGSRVHLAPIGAADLTGYVIGSGRHVEVEAKGPGGKQSVEQVSWQADVEAGGGLYYLAAPAKGEAMVVAVLRCVAELLAVVSAGESKGAE